MAKKDILKLSEDTISELLEMLSVKATVKAELTEAESRKGEEEKPYKYIKIHFEGEDLGAVIGFRGRNLSSLQYIVGLILRRRLGDKDEYRVILDVNDYRSAREDRVRNIAEAYIRDLREKGGDVELHPMKPDERRIIHMYVKEQDDVESESVGEGRDRRVKIQMKSAKK
jgi:spoIIIJ-associated protein